MLVPCNWYVSKDPITAKWDFLHSRIVSVGRTAGESCCCHLESPATGPRPCTGTSWRDSSPPLSLRHQLVARNRSNDTEKKNRQWWRQRCSSSSRNENPLSTLSVRFEPAEAQRLTVLHPEARVSEEKTAVKTCEGALLVWWHSQLLSSLRYYTSSFSTSKILSISPGLN